MKIRIITFRRSTPPEIRKLEQDYVDRLQKTAPVEFVDLKPKSGRYRSLALALDEDSKQILNHVNEREPLVVLDAEGKSLTSEELASWFRNFIHRGFGRVTFIIGSAEGLSAEIKKRAVLKLCLSNLTLPHLLVRLILLEAIYRSFDILGPKKYHK